MLATALVEQIQAMLTEGHLSQREIARLAGVSRGTVGAIARGTRQVRPREDRWEDPLEPLPGPLRRCPGCGGLVRFPCRLCHARADRAERRSPQRLTGCEVEPCFELNEEHEARRRQVEAIRLRQGEDPPQDREPLTVTP